MNSPLSRVLILGGGGMLAHAFRALLPGSQIASPGRSELDITSSGAIQQSLSSFRPTLVLNCAAHTKVDLCEFQRDLAFAINAHAAADVARQTSHLGVPLVHFSTDFVFPGTSPVAYRETDLPGPLSVYGQSKLRGEELVTLENPRALIVRTSWLYGPGGPCFPATMVRVARMGKPLTVVADQHGVPTFTYDLVRSTLALVLSGCTGIYHVSNSQPTTWFEFTRHILSVYQLDVPLTPITSAEWKAKMPASAHRPAYSTLDTSKLASVLGAPPRTWKEAFAEYQPLAG